MGVFNDSRPTAARQRLGSHSSGKLTPRNPQSDNLSCGLGILTVSFSLLPSDDVFLTLRFAAAYHMVFIEYSHATTDCKL